MKTITLACFVLFSNLCLSQDLNQNLLLYYPFDGNTDDTSGNDYHATNFGATLAPDRFGNADSAYYFDGIDDYINFPNLSELKPLLPVSFAFWIKYDSTDYDHQVVFNTSMEENHATSVVFNAQSETGKYVINFADGQYFYGSESRRSYVSNKVISTTEWHHIAIIVNSAADMKIYVDCKEYGGIYSGEGGDLSYSLLPGCIGRHDRSLSLPPGYFQGYIDDFRYWDRALQPADLIELCGELLAVEEAEAPRQDFVLYPNPADDRIYFQTDAVFSKITIHNMAGQKVYEGKFEQSLDVSNFMQGIYLVSLTGDSGVEIKRLIIR